MAKSSSSKEGSSMNRGKFTRPNVKKVLKSLKGFQRDTVEYIFRRLYLDEECTSRFLIADEVGLGKTLVARGVIAKVVDFLWESVERIDVIYICSNQDIAQQNIDRLNIAQERTFQHASRATLLPIKIQQLRNNKLNFVSLTPGTSFNLKSQAGWSWERVVLFNMLRKIWHVSEAGLSNILRGDVRADRWIEQINWFKDNESIDSGLENTFITALNQLPDLRSQYDGLASEIDPRRKRLSPTMRSDRNIFISKMRRLLAKSSLGALEPDLIILDEFQRFKYLLEEDNEFSLLAQELFNYRDIGGYPAKVLLLSATPYKMYTIQGEENEDHYVDFLRTVQFLLNGHEDETNSLQSAIDQYRRAFLGWNLDPANQVVMQSSKKQIETTLRKVMVRTERLAVSQDRNGMLIESHTAYDQLHPTDLSSFVHLDHIARFLGVQDQVEYWKSSAYPLNLMEGYKLKRKLQEAYDRSSENGLFTLLEKAQSDLLKWNDIQSYQEIDPGNARLRDLVSQTLDSGNWRLLWLPPVLPYYLPDGPFGNISEDGFTKTLIFSSWRIVPKVIAEMLSYETERKMLIDDQRDYSYADLSNKRKGLLNFTYSNERLTGMPIFTLIYPCLTLTSRFDPLFLAKAEESNRLTSYSILIYKHRIHNQIAKLLDEATEMLPRAQSGAADERWYWAAPILLDRYFYKSTVESWLYTNDNSIYWRNMLSKETDEGETRFSDHIREIESAFKDPLKLDLGARPEDLEEILTQIAIAGPAVTTIRAMQRVTNTDQAYPAFMAAAAQAGLGFRTLFNQPDVVSFIQSLNKNRPDKENVYWRSVLNYCVQGNLQAVLDEYLHVLNESMGLLGHNPDECVGKLGTTLRQALSIRSPNLRFDDIKVNNIDHSVTAEAHSIRCRYAMRFGTEQGETFEGGTRDTDVRIAFNSPFRPFVLATTSVGQEGLDFHLYCHRVVHWNLPSNPVDLEQREGRVHRYKGHVIRRNLAQRFGLNTVKIKTNHQTDPWAQLFEQARPKNRENDNGLIPFWVYEGGQYSIERVIPILPLSREIGQLEQLKKSLVAYRSVIGQPRQQELLEVLMKEFSIEEIQKIIEEFSIDLSPPVALRDYKDKNI
jgi:hypothetical protein